MKQFFKYVGATVVGLFLFSFVGGYIMLLMFSAILSLASSSEQTTTLKPHSVYKLTLEGTIKDHVSEDDRFSASFAEITGRQSEKVIGLDDILANIRKAKDNDQIEGIYLRCETLSAGYATRQEIRNALLDFKKTGKFIVAYADNYTQGNYYLASVADRVCLNPQGSVDWRGLYASTEYYKRLFDKIGVQMQVLKVGTYKSAVEPYILTKMSDANREQLSTLLSEIWAEMTEAVALSRSINPKQVNALADMNMTLQEATTAVAEGLVDTLVYTEGMDEVLTALCHTDNYKLVIHQKMNNVAEQKNTSKNKIAIVYAEGSISDSGRSGIIGKDMVQTLDDIADDDDINAVVLRVNSPGGSAYASEQIWNAVTLLKKKKPVVVSMGDYAASGGYYISCNANYIIAEPNTLTGSIGIFGLVPNLSGATDKVGLDFDGVGTNKYSGMSQTMILKGMTADEQQQMQQMINRGYELFTLRCADGRKMSQDEIKEIAEGRVWSGQHAFILGLVDQLGTLNTAINKAAELAYISDYKTVTYPEADNMLTILLKSLDMEATLDRWAKARLGQTYGIAAEMEELAKEPTIQTRMVNITIE